MSFFTIIYCVYLNTLSGSLLRMVHLVLMKEGITNPLINAGRMSPLTAIGFIAAGATLFYSFVPFNTLFLRIVSDIFVFLMLLLGSAGVISYFYGMPLIYGTDLTSVSLPSSFLFILLAVTQIIYNGERSSFFYLIFGKSLLHKMIRAFLPPVALFFLIDGWVDLSQPGLLQLNPAVYHTIEALIGLSIIMLVIFFVTNWVVRDIEGTQKELRESEEKFRNLFNNAEVGMFRSRLDGTKLLDLNDKYLSIIGRTRQEVLGKPSVIFWADPRKRDEMVKMLKVKGCVDDLECKMLNKSGEVRDCLTSLRFYQETGILEGSIIDITTRKKAEEEYRIILQTTMDAFYLVDSEGRIIDVNDAYCSIIGYSREELLKMGIKDVEAVETEEVIKDRIQQIKEIGGVRFESKHRRKDGRVINIEASVHFLKTDKEKFFVFMRDITERKRAEEALKLSQQDLVRAQGIAHIGSWNWDIKKDKIDCSEEICRIYGINTKNFGFTIKDFIKLTHPDDLSRFIRGIELLTAGKPFKPFEYRILRSDGIERTVRVEGADLVKNPDGPPGACSVLSRTLPSVNYWKASW